MTVRGVYDRTTEILLIGPFKFHVSWSHSLQSLDMSQHISLSPLKDCEFVNSDAK